VTPRHGPRPAPIVVSSNPDGVVVTPAVPPLGNEHAAEFMGDFAGDDEFQDYEFYEFMKR
jgi:hypothetical protein